MAGETGEMHAEETVEAAAPLLDAYAAAEPVSLGRASLKFDAQGLITCVVQDAEDGRVLMVAWMDAEAVRRTLEEGTTWFWSRSRQEYWHKGETSGNTQELVALLLDCDADTLIALVHPKGPACHTGHDTCFYRRLTS